MNTGILNKRHASIRIIDFLFTIHEFANLLTKGTQEQAAT
jgi:hypothetical protein